jgi:polyhydroxyalkanoate synthesis regulator phasin
MDLANVAVIAAAIVGGGGVFGGIYGLLKVRPEAGQIAVSAAGSALVVQVGVIETLREEMTELRTRVDGLETERDKLRLQAFEAQAEAAKAKSESAALKGRVTRLENQIRALGAIPESH